MTVSSSETHCARPSFAAIGTDTLLPFPLTEYLPTLAVTLAYGDGEDRTALIGIRSAANNINHPDVVSVPTMRQPVANALALVADLLQGPPLMSLLQPSIAHRPLGFAVWSLLAAKLSLGDAIEAKEFDLEVQDFAIVQGQSSLTNLETGEEFFEKLTMINCLGRVTRGAQLVPAANPTFSYMSFESYNALGRVASTKDLSELGAAYAGFETCIHGLCIATALVLRSAPFAHAWAVEPRTRMERLGVEWLGYGTCRETIQLSHAPQVLEGLS